MTPEELNRTIEFIIQSQARLAAAQEQDREERIEFQKSTIEFRKWSKDLDRRVMDLIQNQAQILAIQSQRLDQHEKRFSEMQEEFHQTHKRQDETFAWLTQMIEKIIDRLN